MGTGTNSGFELGEMVEVRSKAEILATLDRRGELDSLPFMPEMLEYSGKRMRVYRRAIKTCDTVNMRGLHRMDDAVHLEGARCSGQAHGACEARCLLFWKEAWLKRLSAGDMAAPAGVGGLCDEDSLHEATLENSEEASEPIYRCQATEMPRAAPSRMPWWHISQYVRDVRAGNATAWQMASSLAVMLFNKFQSFDRKFLPGRGLIQNAQHWPFLDGSQSSTPKETIGLRPGDVVRVKTRREIVATLSSERKNRGLSFDAEMSEYCGKEYRVLARVGQIVDEKSGRIIRLSSDCVILEGVVCTGKHYQYCSRSIYPYWREVWLELVAREGERPAEPPLVRIAATGA